MLTDFELSATDRHFGRFILRQAGAGPELVGVLASLVSSLLGDAHICLELDKIAGGEIRVDGCPVSIPPLGLLRETLASSAVVGAPGEYRPLVLDEGSRLYLYRYWNYERDLARLVREMAASAPRECDDELLTDGLRRLFPPAPEGEADWQRIAALAALRKRFCVISGGPGTGKTSTVVRILALLLEQEGERPLRIALAAPTGKAAARLMESISRAAGGLDCDERIREMIPRQVATIHRLLGSRPGSSRFRFSAGNRLPHDLVVVDEASMVALPLMAKLALALKPECRLILLGDRDQLASVEAGAVLGDMCGAGEEPGFSEGFARRAASLTGAPLPLDPVRSPAPLLTDSLVVLKKNYRFRREGGIGALAALVNGGDGAGALEILRTSGNDGLAWRVTPRREEFANALAGLVVDGYGPCLRASSAEEALRFFDRFRLLCALRQGPWGVVGINALVERILAGRGLIDPRERWYRGRPVMITANDYTLKLFNGDIGVVFPDPASGNKLQVHFPAPEGGVRPVSPLRLPAHETVYAMTIHKSQGSEFDRVLMLLPSHDTEVMTRELVYTGITRAREGVEIWGNEELFLAAVKRRTRRSSGLREALWGKGAGEG